MLMRTLDCIYIQFIGIFSNRRVAENCFDAIDDLPNTESPKDFIVEKFTWLFKTIKNAIIIWKSLTSIKLKSK